MEYIQDSLLRGKALTTQAFAQTTNKEVMNYVQNTKNALGVIGVNWISDNQDEENLAFSKTIFPVFSPANSFERTSSKALTPPFST